MISPSTKQAVLPSGEVIHFPPDTPDEHIHAQVRQRMGMGPPEAPRPTTDQFGAVLGHLGNMAGVHAGTTEMMRNTVDRATQMHGAAMQELMNGMAESRQLNAQMVEAINRVADLAMKIEVSNQEVIRALRAKKTVTKGKDGSFSLNVSNEEET